jgi:hypothetical protein
MDQILFPGQDYNNARIYDFEDVDKWENNKRQCCVFLLALPFPSSFLPSARFLQETG